MYFKYNRKNILVVIGEHMCHSFVIRTSFLLVLFVCVDFRHTEITKYMYKLNILIFLFLCYLPKLQHLITLKEKKINVRVGSCILIILISQCCVVRTAFNM